MSVAIICTSSYQNYCDVIEKNVILIVIGKLIKIASSSRNLGISFDVALR